MAQQLSFDCALTERDRILSAFREKHHVYLESVRAFAREIAALHGEVTIDDVRERLERSGFPMPADIGADERVFGALFTKKDFVPIGQRKTRRKEWAARVGTGRSAVTIYRLRAAV